MYMLIKYKYESMGYVRSSACQRKYILPWSSDDPSNSMVGPEPARVLCQRRLNADFALSANHKPEATFLSSD